MSGGSFNYLYSNMDELMFQRFVFYSMEEMAEELKELGYEQIANETIELKGLIETYLKKADDMLKNQKYFAYIYEEYDEYERFGDRGFYHLNELEEEHENDPQALKKIQSLHQFLKAAAKEVEEKRAKLEPVWKAVEWHKSADWGFDSVEEAIKDYQKNKK